MIISSKLLPCERPGEHGQQGVCAYGHNCTDQAARATPIDSATPKTKARTAAFVEAQATSPSPNVATSAAQAFADHISWSGAPRVRAKRTGWFAASTE